MTQEKMPFVARVQHELRQSAVLDTQGLGMAAGPELLPERGENHAEHDQGEENHNQHNTVSIAEAQCRKDRLSNLLRCEAHTNVRTQVDLQVVMELDEQRAEIDARQHERRPNGEHVELKSLERVGRHEEHKPDKARQQRADQTQRDVTVSYDQRGARQDDSPYEVDGLPEEVLQRTSEG